MRRYGVGRFREYSKYRFVFPTAAPAPSARGVGTRGVGASVLAHRAALLAHRAAASLQPLEEREESLGQRDGDGFYVPINVDNTAGGTLLEIPDEKFNQPPGYTFTGRPDSSKEYATTDRRFKRVSPAMVALPEFAEIIRRFAAVGLYKLNAVA